MLMTRANEAPLSLSGAGSEGGGGASVAASYASLKLTLLPPPPNSPCTHHRRRGQLHGADGVGGGQRGPPPHPRHRLRHQPQVSCPALPPAPPMVVDGSGGGKTSCRVSALSQMGGRRD